MQIPVGYLYKVWGSYLYKVWGFYLYKIGGRFQACGGAFCSRFPLRGGGIRAKVGAPFVQKSGPIRAQTSGAFDANIRGAHSGAGRRGRALGMVVPGLCGLVFVRGAGWVFQSLAALLTIVSGSARSFCWVRIGGLRCFDKMGNKGFEQACPQGLKTFANYFQKF